MNTFTKNLITLAQGIAITTVLLVVIGTMAGNKNKAEPVETAPKVDSTLEYIVHLKQLGMAYREQAGINSVVVKAQWSHGGMVAIIDHALTKADMIAINNTGMPINHALAQVACIDFANNTPKATRTHAFHVTASSNGGNTATVKCW